MSRPCLRPGAARAYLVHAGGDKQYARDVASGAGGAAVNVDDGYHNARWVDERRREMKKRGIKTGWSLF